MVYCTRCGSVNAEESAFCNKCGSQLMVPGTEPEIGETTTSQTSIWGQTEETSARPASPGPFEATGQQPLSQADLRRMHNEWLRQAGPPEHKRSNHLWIALIAIVVVIVVIVATIAVIDPSFGSTLTGTHSEQVHNGDYLIYSATGTASSLPLSGTLTLEFSNVTSNSCTMETTINLNGRTASSSDVVALASGGMTSTTGSVPGASGPATLIGRENISTNYGQKITNHYSIPYSDYTYEFWEDAGNHVPYLLRFVYTDGMVLNCKLTSTNMM